MKTIYTKSQVDNYPILNSPKFWDKKILLNENNLLNSPIYLRKNKLIVEDLRKSHGKLLDIGFGYGYLEKLLYIKNKRLKLFGIDISSEAVRKLKKIIPGNFKLGKITKIPFKNNFFDYVLVLDVLEHISKENNNKSLFEIDRVLKHKGTLIISVPINELENDSKNNHHLRKYTYNLLKKEIEHFHFKIFKSYTLVAFKNHYFLKNIVNNLFKLRKPNLLIVFAKK